jgi:hypothetical protein
MGHLALTYLSAHHRPHPTKKPVTESQKLRCVGAITGSIGTTPTTELMLESIIARMLLPIVKVNG